MVKINVETVRRRGVSFLYVETLFFCFNKPRFSGKVFCFRFMQIHLVFEATGTLSSVLSN